MRKLSTRLWFMDWEEKNKNKKVGCLVGVKKNERI
jgi:hypothetical protein